MIEGGQTNQWRSYLLFRKKAKWKPWQSFVGEAANRLGCRRGSSRANRRDGGHSTAGSVGQANLCVCLYCGHTCAAYNTPVSPCTRLFGRTGHLQIKHGSSNTSTNWGHCETNKQTNLIVSLISFAANQSSMFEGKVQGGQPLRTEPTNVVLH